MSITICQSVLFYLEVSRLILYILCKLSKQGFLISSRRLEVSRVELLLQVGTFCVAVGALVAGNSLLMKFFWTKISQFILSCWWFVKSVLSTI